MEQFPVSKIETVENIDPFRLHRIIPRQYDLNYNALGLAPGLHFEPKNGKSVGHDINSDLLGGVSPRD